MVRRYVSFLAFAALELATWAAPSSLRCADVWGDDVQGGGRTVLHEEIRLRGGLDLRDHLLPLPLYFGLARLGPTAARSRSDAPDDLTHSLRGFSSLLQVAKHGGTVPPFRLALGEALLPALVDLPGLVFDFDDDEVTPGGHAEWALRRFCKRLRPLPSSGTSKEAQAWQEKPENGTPQVIEEGGDGTAEHEKMAVRRVAVRCHGCNSSSSRSGGLRFKRVVGSGAGLPFLGMDESYELGVAPNSKLVGGHGIGGSSGGGDGAGGASSWLDAATCHGLTRGLETLVQVLLALPPLLPLVSEVTATNGVSGHQAINRAAAAAARWAPGVITSAAPATISSEGAAAGNECPSVRLADLEPEAAARGGSDAKGSSSAGTDCARAKSLGSESAVVVALVVRDAPAVPWRGLLLDTARHPMPVRLVARVIDAMASAKLNVLHWHFTDAVAFGLDLGDPTLPGHRGTTSNDDCIGRRGHGFYSREDAAFIVAHAANLSVRVVPEVDLPAHTASWRGTAQARLIPEPASADTAASASASLEAEVESSAFAGCDLPPLTAARFPGYTERPFLKRLDLVSLSPAGPGAGKARELVARVLTAVSALFPDQFLHLGGDEVEVKCWVGDPVTAAALQAEGLTPTAALARQLNHAVRFAVEELGKDVVLWQDAHDLLGPILIVDYPEQDQGSKPGESRTNADDESGSAARTQQQQLKLVQRVHVQPWKCWGEGDYDKATRKPVASGHAAAGRAVRAAAANAAAHKAAANEAAENSAGTGARAGARKAQAFQPVEQGVVSSTCWYLDWDSQWHDFFSHSPLEGTGLNPPQRTTTWGRNRPAPAASAPQAPSLPRSSLGAIPTVWGGEAAMWTERVDWGNIECRLWPRALAIAERLWSLGRHHKGHREGWGEESRGTCGGGGGLCVDGGGDCDEASGDTGPADDASIALDSVRERLFWHALRMTTTGDRTALAPLHLDPSVVTATVYSYCFSAYHERVVGVVEAALADVSRVCPLLPRQEVDLDPRDWEPALAAALTLKEPNGELLR